MKIKIKRSKENGELYAVINSDGNNKQIWRTSETNKRRKTVDNAIELLKRGAMEGFEIIDETK